jgi:hypothetical protein
MGSVLGLLGIEQWNCCVQLVCRRVLRPDLVLGAVLLPVSLRMVTLGHLASPAYDEVAFALVVVSALYILRLDHGEPGTATVAVLIATSAAIVRPQYALYVGSALGFIAWQQGRQPECRLLRSAVLAAVPLVAGSLFLVTNAMSSGYPLFPLTIAGLPVDWRVPHRTADQLQPLIRDFARLIGPGTTSGWSWFGQWTQRNIHQWRFASAVLLFAVGLVVLSLAAMLRRRRLASEPWREAQLPLIAVVAAASANTLWWFVSAPDPRFGLGVIWLTAAGTLTMGVVRLTTPRLGGTVLAATFVGLLVPAIIGLHHKQLFTVWPATWIDHRLNLVGAPVPRSPRLVRTPTATYLVTTFRDQCWDAPIPCAPTPVVGLEQRGPSLRQGYRTTSHG